LEWGAFEFGFDILFLLRKQGKKFLGRMKMPEPDGGMVVVLRRENGSW